MAVLTHATLPPGVSERPFGVPELEVLVYKTRSSDLDPILRYYLQWDGPRKYAFGRDQEGTRKHSNVQLPHGCRSLEFRIERKDDPTMITVYSIARKIEAYIKHRRGTEKKPSHFIAPKDRHNFSLSKRDYLRIHLRNDTDDYHVDIYYHARDGVIDSIFRFFRGLRKG